MVLVCTAILPAVSVLAQGANPSETDIAAVETVETVTGRVSLTESSRQAWNLSQTDWDTYTTLMQGPSGIWYPHLAPAAVLGIHAATEAERDRFARIVFEQERHRLDLLFAFNRAYTRMAREERTKPGFGYFGEYADVSALAGPGLSNINSSRLLVFIGQDCPPCDRTVRELSRSGRPFDIYYVGAGSDAEISRWARRVGLPPAKVRDRSITLNHDSGFLSQTGNSSFDLPILFRDPSLSTPVSLEAALTR